MQSRARRGRDAGRPGRTVRGPHGLRWASSAGAPMDGKTVVVTGGAGFLGSHFIRRALAAGAALVVNVDRLTYAGDRRRLGDVSEDRRYCFVRGDVEIGRAHV